MYYRGIDMAGVSSYVTDEKGGKWTAGAVDTKKEAFEGRLKPFLKQVRTGTFWLLAGPMVCAIVAAMPRTARPSFNSLDSTQRIRPRGSPEK